MRLNTNYLRHAAFLHDVIMAISSWALAYLLRFNFDIPHDFLRSMAITVALALPIQISAFWVFGLYRGIWRFASIPDLQRILKAVGSAAVLFSVVLIIIRPDIIVPRSVLILAPMLLLLLMGGSRFAYRAWREYKLYGSTKLHGEPVLILGAGDAAIALLKDLDRSHEWRVVGLIDDDSTLIGREIMGVKVLGGSTELPEIARKLAIRNVIVAMPSATHQNRRRMVEVANQCGLVVMTVPAFDDLMNGKVVISQVRRVEVEDLLGREPVRLDDDGLHELLADKVVLVSGAGGSIGSELCRQIIKYQPKQLVCLELSEYALYRLEQEFAVQVLPNVKISYVIADVKHESRLKSVLQRFKPSVVFHAAAYKHVPLMERDNVSEALNNNVYGTYQLARACKKAKVGKFVLISTDKAVNPTNVMGASKRLAEMVCQGLQEESGTRFVIVRFGNVLGSSGSVIPKFRAQISNGGPVTVTHPDITRYFMSIPEAAQLVMQAGMMGEGGEIFVLDMGDPVRIADLARDMIRLSGLHEDEIKIEYTGLRPGEKLYEELLADDERTLPTPHDKLRIAVARSADDSWVNALLKWIETITGREERLIKQELQMWVEEYMIDGQPKPAEEQTPLAPRSSTIH